MRRFGRRLSTMGQLLLVTLFGLPLITPLLRGTAVPCTHDGHLHYHRIAAMRYAWENGLYFTRWLPDLAFGYGYPFFVYREPLPLYAVFWPHLLGLPLPAATNLFYALTILACGWFMFLWARDVLDERAALVAAVAYMTAPYVLIDALIRGNSPESLALPLFPLLLWSSRRWLLAHTHSQFTIRNSQFIISFLISTFGLAFLSLSHNISTLIFAPTLLIYLLALAWLYRLPWRTTLTRLALIFGLGLGMTLFYTGGALLEMDQVTLQQSTTTRNNDFHYNFTTLAEIFAPVAAEDPQLLNPPLPFRLGWVVTALAVVGLGFTIYDLRLTIGDWRGSNRQSSIVNRQLERCWHVWLMLAGTAVYLLMSLPLSQPIWENVPLIDFLQFPWRLVGRAALPLAFLAAVPFAQGRRERREEREERRESPGTQYALRNMPFALALFAALALLTLETIPNLYPNYCQEKALPTINDVHEYEHVTGLVGVDPEGSYFPRTVAQRPAASPLEADYQAGRTPQRFDGIVLPSGAAVERVEYNRLAATIHLTTPTPFTARYLSFAFPGWTAVVDGTPVPITPSDPEGLITFLVPAGTHTLTIRWQSTPLRTALLAVSLLAFVGTLATAVFLARKLYSVNHKPSPRLRTTAYGLRLTDYRLFLLPLALLAAKLLVFDRVPTPLRRAAPPDVTYPLLLQGGELRLDGYNLSRARVPAGGIFDIDMAWTAVSPPQIEYQTNVWLVGPEGLTWSAKGTERPRLYEDVPATRLWQPGQWAWDSREVQVFTGTLPGTYDIVLTLFDKATLQPLTLTDAAGAVVGPTAVLGQITVITPETPPNFAPQYALMAAAPDLGLSLLGYNQDRDAAAPGESVLLTLFWQREALDDAVEFMVDLLDEEGTAVHTWTLPLTRPDLTDWLPGERLRGQYLLRLPAALESGRYQFALPGGARLGTLHVDAPERVFVAVGVETAVNAPFFTLTNEHLATLTGYTLSTLRAPLSIILVWQATAEFPTSYRVFIHLVDADGHLLAQTDGEPANWTRPTTGWAAGEYITDPYQLTLPDPLPSNLSLRVGLYDPDTGQRLHTETAADFVTIPLP